MFRTRWAVIALLTACLLGGCTDDDPEPNIDSDPASSSPTVSQSMSTSPTGTPTTSDSAVDTIKMWIDAQNVALRSGDTSGLRALSADGCQGCSDFPDGIDEIYNAGGHFEGGEWTFVRAKVEDKASVSAKVNVAVRIAGGTTVTAAGAEPTSYEPKSRLMVFELEPDSGGWLISLIGFLS